MFLNPTTLDEAIQDRIYWMMFMDSEKVSIAIRRCTFAKKAIYETAPRDKYKLSALIVQKEKQIRASRKVSESDVPISELEALKDLDYLVYKFSK